MACLQDVFDIFFAVVKGFVSECAYDLRFCMSPKLVFAAKESQVLMLV